MFKPPQVGKVHVKVEEIRGVGDVCCCRVVHDEVEEETKHINPKQISDQKWNDQFEFKVHTLQSDVKILPMKKRLMGMVHDKPIGVAKIPLPSLKDEEEHHEWIPILEHVSSKKLQKNLKMERKQIGEVRVHVQYTSLNPKKKREIKGILIEDKWTKETCGGPVMNHGTWMKNPQFLLSLEKETNVNVTLFQPDELDTRISFYVLKYEDDWNGRKKVVYSPDDIMKIDTVWAALFSEEAQANLDLKQGKYVIIPCTEHNEGYDGPFSLNVFASNEGDQDSIKVEKLPLSEDKQWKTIELEGKWTKTTAGGGNITGVNWRKNPQYLVTVDEETCVSVSLAQEDKDYAIGFYLMEYHDFEGKKAIIYKDEIAKTDNFKYLPSCGIKNIKLSPGKYVIIPCTSQPKEAKFVLSLFSDKEVDMYELTKSWPHVIKAKCEWKGENAGGSPNNETFVNNPQFLFKIPSGKRTEFVVDLSVPDENDAIGFLVVSQDGTTTTALSREDIKKDDIYCQPEGWQPRLSVSVYATATEKVASSKSFVVIPSTFNTGVEKKFALTIFSDQEIELSQLGNSLCEKEQSE